MTMMEKPAAIAPPGGGDDLPADNASRLAIYDALHQGEAPDGAPPALTENQLFDRVIPRLRMLVPRELHLRGEREYVAEKIQVCSGAGLLTIEGGADDGSRVVRLTGEVPQIRLPDGTIGLYWHDLEPARERIDSDNAALRAASFNVRDHIPSIADEPDGLAFRALLQSMEEHGYLRQCWIAEAPDGEIIDGLARKRAAEALGLKIPTVTYPHGREKEAARRRDTPLNRVAIAIDLNRARIDEGIIDLVHNEVSRVTRRPWAETAEDLAITRDWRKVVPKDYVPMLEVDLLPFRAGDEPQVQVTPDGRVQLRSLVVASGLAPYKAQDLERYVATEEARSKFATRKAVFARAQDIVAGIAAMKVEKLGKKNSKFDPQWDLISEWLEKKVIR
jgi:hypothetical protein